MRSEISKDGYHGLEYGQRMTEMLGHCTVLWDHTHGWSSTRPLPLLLCVSHAWARGIHSSLEAMHLFSPGWGLSCQTNYSDLALPAFTEPWVQTLAREMPCVPAVRARMSWRREMRSPPHRNLSLTAAQDFMSCPLTPSPVTLGQTGCCCPKRVMETGR
jgi:hypothetical protein